MRIWDEKTYSEATYAIKLPVFPSMPDSRAIDGQSKICNWLFNNLLEKAHNLKQEYKEHGNKDAGRILYTKRGFRNELTRLKKEKPFLKSVHSSPLKNTALRLSRSIKAYQDSRKGRRKGKAIGWPKFKSFKREFFSLEYEEPFKGYAVHDGILELSFGLGEERKQNHIKMPMPDSKLIKDKNVKKMTLVKESGLYFAIFTVTKKLPQEKIIKKTIALDPNHKNLAYGVDSECNAVEIENAYWLKNYEKRFDELKSKRDRCKRKSQLIEVKNAEGEIIKSYWKASRRYERYQRVLERARAKRRDQIKTYRYSVANALYKHYDLVTIGDYTPHGGGISKKMRRAMNNQSTIGKFKKTLSWCAEKAGKKFSIWNEKGSTQTCHACLKIVPKGLSPNIREWTCAHCKTHHYRMKTVP
ncbi:MAG TPA: transposase [Myxococcota bacterium]|nr:transposase [Myxococcota bacterium]